MCGIVEKAQGQFTNQKSRQRNIIEGKCSGERSKGDRRNERGGEQGRIGQTKDTFQKKEAKNAYFLPRAEQGGKNINGAKAAAVKMIS